jgi:uncharacterized protein (DUF2236 family)
MLPDEPESEKEHPMTATNAPPRGFRNRIVRDIEAAGGRHDEPEIYAEPLGDAGLAGGPGSISWEINGDFASLVLGGTAAILMEVLHPSVMHGVFTQSSYRTDPLRRARNTLGYVLRTTFGSTPAATAVIERVKAIHARVNGTREDGVEYRALDPELIAWVHTCIPWAVMTAFERTRRPLARDEKDRYLREQALIGRLGGADRVPETVDELEEYVERMRPLMAMNSQTTEFLGFIEGRVDQAPVGAQERVDRWVAVRASMGLMPEWARRMTGTYLPESLQRMFFAPMDRLKARIIRWTYPAPPCVAMAVARATAMPHAAQAAAEDARAEESAEPCFGRAG